MENKINLVELLKDCPTGMELDCLMYDNVTFVSASSMHTDYPIKIRTASGFKTSLTKYGQNVKNEDAKCVIFPKGKTTWDGFQRPFKDGDIVATNSGMQIFILQRAKSNNEGYCYIGCTFGKNNCFLDAGLWGFDRLATEEEKAKLFKAIKDNGYKWNDKTKTLEKLIEPYFNVGDIVYCINNIDTKFKITGIANNYYICENDFRIYFKFQDYYELVPNKFDITTLKPFDKVLVRLTNVCVWMPKFFSYYDTNPKIKYYPFITIDNIGYPQCIPYKNNEHLSNTTDDCNDFYKTWK